MSFVCPLCKGDTVHFYKDKNRTFEQCKFCHSVLMPPNMWPSVEQERTRYLEHDNDVDDPRFQAFVSPITDAVQQDFAGLKAHGLDFGAGHAPVITHILAERGYQISAYDPLFSDQPELLTARYDFICCCEVIEHFHAPRKMFSQLYDLLLPGGKLYCMTALYEEQRDFAGWQYKNDPTHVIIYHRDAINYIQQQFGFASVTIDERLITFTKAQ